MKAVGGWRLAVGGFGVVLIFAGCGFLKRPDNQFYSLDTIAPTGAVVAVSGTPLGVDGVELPPGLDRRGIFLRGSDPHRVEVRGTHQWTSSLEEMVTHTLAFDLAGRLPEGMVILPGQAKPMETMRSLYVTFEELAAGPDQIFVLDARWTLGDLAAHERITVQMNSLESASVASAMSQALALLADRIVARL